MLENIIFSVNTTVPIFLIVFLGWFLNRKKFLPQEFYPASEKLVFKIALPCMLFNEVANSRAESMGSSLRLIAFCSAGIVISFFLYCLLVPLFVKDNDKRGAFIQGAYRSNFAILGVPLAKNMFGDAGASVIAVLMPFVIVLFNVFAVIVLSMYAPKDVKKTPGQIVRQIAKSVVTNPLIIAVVLGLPFLFLDISLPVFAAKTVTYLSNTTFALALISLGAGFTFPSLKGKLKYSLTASVCKTVILPITALLIGYLLGFHSVDLGVIFVLFGSPTAVSSYIMAKNMKSDHELAGQILLMTTFMCLFTIFIGVFLLRTVGWI